MEIIELKCHETAFCKGAHTVVSRGEHPFAAIAGRTELNFMNCGHQ